MKTNSTKCLPNETLLNRIPAVTAALRSAG
jgi:hypothetical protein